MGLNEKSIYFVCNKKSKQMAGSTKIQMKAKNKKTAFENLEVNRRSYNVSSKGKGKKLSESSQIRYQTEEDISLETKHRKRERIEEN